ncbi:MAG: flagellin [Planctomycetes bacterium]|nr:flagellin [Planctomycetota bacterium]
MTRINTNVQSLIAQRSLGINNRSLNTALQRLSSGLRINSGRDDPAGLIASETLRSSIRAISTAIDNAVRADTIVAVAEGGLQEISSLLLGLENLVDQSANEAGVTPEEIAANQLQIDSILQSIDRLAEATAFGNKKLLNGAFAFTTSGINITEATGASVNHLDAVQINSAKIPAGAFRTVNLTVVTRSEVAIVSAVGAGTTGAGANPLNGTLAAATTIQVRGNFGADTISFASGATAANIVSAVNASKDLTGVSATASAASGGSTSVVFQSTTYGADAFVSISVLENATTAFVSQAADVKDFGANGTVTVNGASAIVNGLDVSVRAGTLSADMTLTSAFGSVAGGTTSFEVTGGGAIFSISPTVGLSGQETIGIEELSAAKLGNASVGFLTTLKSGLANDLSKKNFATAQRIVRAAINEVASLRGRLGAFQKDTLSTTINSLQIARENVTAAESAIRDADFALETSNLTRAQILVSSSTSVLQLANAQPQSALALLG